MSCFWRVQLGKGPGAEPGYTGEIVYHLKELEAAVREKAAQHVNVCIMHKFPFDSQQSLMKSTACLVLLPGSENRL